MDAALPDIIERIYAASVAPDRWPDALRALAGAVDGTACGLRIEGIETPSFSQRWIGLDPAFERAYVEAYWSHDVWAAEGKRGRVGAAAVGDALIEPRARRQNAFINELCTPYGIDDLVGGLVSLTPQTMISFAAMRQRGQRPFDDAHAAIVERLVPHVRRALLVEDALLGARRDEKIAWAVVDRLPLGAFVLDARRRVLHANAVASRLVAEGLVLDARPIRELLATGEPRIVAVNGKRLTAIVVPLPEEESVFDVASDRGRVLLVVTDPAARTVPSAELLTQLYGLTSAESRVALLVGGGLAPKEAADQLGTAWNTVRAQLRAIYAKTGTGGQSALVRLLVMLGVGSSAT